MKLAKSVVLALSLCLLLTSCFRVENSLKVNDDGSVEIDQVFAVNVEEFSPESIGLEGDSIPRSGQRAFCRGIEQGIRDSQAELLGLDISEYSDGDYCGARLSLGLDPATDHSDALTMVFEQNVRLVQLADGWDFEMFIAPAQIANRSGFNLREYEDVVADVELVLELEMPGQAIPGQHNATDVSGGVFRWELDVLEPEIRLHATTGPATGFDRLPVSPRIMIFIGINIALFGGVAWYFLRPEDEPEVAIDMNPAAVASPTAAIEAAPKGTPVFDETYQIWTIDDPVQGKMWHREGTDEWVPF